MGKIIRIATEQSGKMTAIGLIATLTVTMVLSGVLMSYQANAGTITVFSDTLSVSAPSSASNHTIVFTVNSAVAGQGSISLAFDAGSNNFDLSGLTEDDVDVASAGGQFETAASASGEILGVAFYPGSSDHMSIKLGSGNNIATGEVLTVTIGTNATNFGTGANQIDNPASVASYPIDAYTYSPAGVELDSGRTFIAIVNQVTLNAVVNASFTFVIDGVDTGQTIDESGQAVASASTATYVGFGTLTAGTPVMMGSSLSVTTNAANGFVVTVQQNHNMLASSGADIDSFVDGTAGGSAVAWASPTGTIGSENTYGHLGIHTEDGSGTISGFDNIAASVSSTTDGYWIGFNGTNTRTIWAYNGPADGLTQDIGHIDVGYRAEITGLQEAGRYQSRLMYIATPTF